MFGVLCLYCNLFGLHITMALYLFSPSLCGCTGHAHRYVWGICYLCGCTGHDHRYVGYLLFFNMELMFLASDAVIIMPSFFKKLISLILSWNISFLLVNNSACVSVLVILSDDLWYVICSVRVCLC